MCLVTDSVRIALPLPDGRQVVLTTGVLGGVCRLVASWGAFGEFALGVYETPADTGEVCFVDSLSTKICAGQTGF